MNPSLLSYIKDFDPDMAICVFTNDGHLEYKNSGTVDLLLLKVFYNTYSITTILELVDVTSQFRVTMDTNNKPAMFVHTGPDYVLKFFQYCEGL